MTEPSSRIPRRFRRRAIACAVVASFAVGACSDDRGGESATPDTAAADTTVASDTTAAPTTDAPTEDVLRIGLEAPLSGSQSGLGEGMLQGAQLAADQLNADGGVLGRQVEIVAIDDAADPDTGETAAKAAIEAGLDGIVGPYNSGVGTITLPLYIEAGLVPIRLTSATSTEGLGFTLQAMTSQIAPRAVDAMSEWLDAGSVAMIVDTTQEYTTQEGEAVRDGLESAGVDVAAYEEITPGESSYADAISAALDTNPDVVYLATYFPEAAVIAKELADGEDTTSCVASYASFDNVYLEDAGDAASRCQVLGVPSPEEYPDADTYMTAFEDAFGTAPNVWTPYTYDSVLVLADAMERAGSTDADALTTALASTGDTGWSGWTGTVQFDSGTGNREPNPVVVLDATADGWKLNADWASFAGVTD